MLMLGIGTGAHANRIVLDYQQQEEVNSIIEQEISDVEKAGLLDEENEGPLTNDEQRILNMKIEAIEKRIYEQETLRPYVEDLYQSNARDAFDEKVRERLGFTPEQWRELRRRQVEVDKAKNEPINDVKIRIREETLDNGSVKPIDINVVRGYASAIVFVDAAGNPWPIEGDITGDSESYNTRVSLDHVAIIDNVKEFRESNTLVNLSGMDIPIVLRLKSNRDTSDSRVIIHLPDLGPNSESDLEVVSNTPRISGALEELMNTGRIKGYREFGFNEIPGSVFFNDGWMLIRTKDSLYLPQPVETGRSPTGYNVYRVPATNNFLFASKSGKKFRASLSGERDFNVKYKSRLFEE